MTDEDTVEYNTGEMTKLAEALKRYYTRNNKQITFLNGDTLNKLAINMSDDAGYGFDAGALSRILSGKRLFTPKQVDIFCDTVGLSERDRTKLQQALAQDVLARYDFHEPIVENKDAYTKMTEYVLYYETEKAELLDSTDKHHDQMVSDAVDVIRAGLSKHAPHMMPRDTSSIPKLSANKD